jgi:transposase-like protein
MSRHYQSYSQETKLRAIKMYFEEGLSQKEITEALGIYDKDRVKKWISAYRKEGQLAFTARKGRPSKQPLDKDEYIKRLEMENELLKKFHTLLRRW